MVSAIFWAMAYITMYIYISISICIHSYTDLYLRIYIGDESNAIFVYLPKRDELWLRTCQKKRKKFHTNKETKP